MNRTEFLAQLERLLGDVPQAEREAALEYYSSYFEEAGEEKEGAVIQELGSPGKVAAIIKADLAGDGSLHGEYTEAGYQDQRFQERKMPGTFQEKRSSGEYREEENQAGTRHRASWENQSRGYDGPYRRAGYDTSGPVRRGPNRKQLWLLILLLLVAVPVFGLSGSAVIVGLAGGAFGLLIGIVCGVLGLLAGGLGLIVAGCLLLVQSLVFLLPTPATAVACAGGALILLALGILLLTLFCWLILKVFPAVLRWTVDRIQRIVHKGIRGGENP